MTVTLDAKLVLPVDPAHDVAVVVVVEVFTVPRLHVSGPVVVAPLHVPWLVVALVDPDPTPRVFVN